MNACNNFNVYGFKICKLGTCYIIIIIRSRYFQIYRDINNSVIFNLVPYVFSWEMFRKNVFSDLK